MKTMRSGSSVVPWYLAALVATNLSIVNLPAADAPWKTYQDKSDEWFRGSEGARIATNILSHQSRQGSWPKNLDTTSQPYTGDPSLLKGTFDNDATFGELRFLAHAYRATQNPRYRQAFLLGLDHVLEAQYPSGGWPQLYPPGKGYQRHTTFNDDAMVNILNFLDDLAHSVDFSFVDAERRTRAGRSVASGIHCILACQIEVKGVPTIWCGQHDEKTYKPRWGRTFEPPALTSAESAGILRLLMSQDNPSPEVKRSVHAGARWFERAAIEGIRQIVVNGDKVIIRDPRATPLWARFYDLGTNRPIFCGRDGVIREELAQIEAERRNGYAWYGSWGQDVATRYTRWKERWDRSPSR